MLKKQSEPEETDVMLEYFVEGIGYLDMRDLVWS